MSILLGRESDSILGKRKDIEPCPCQFAEEEAGSENKEAGGENEEAGSENEETDSENEVLCKICLKYGHWFMRCPYKRVVPKDTEIVGPDWILVCKHCNGYEFNLDEHKSCIFCGSSYKRVARKWCACCNAIGHLIKDCPYKDLIDLTGNLNFYVPPPAGAQGAVTQG